jgi:hypothetical protein
MMGGLFTAGRGGKDKVQAEEPSFPAGGQARYQAHRMCLAD